MRHPRHRLVRRIAQGITALAAVFGGFALDRLQTDFLPRDNVSVLRWLWRDPGLSAVQLEERYARPVEERVRGLLSVADIESRLRPGQAEITVRYSDARDTPAINQTVSEWVAGENRPPPEWRVHEGPDRPPVLVWRLRISGEDRNLIHWAETQVLPAVRALSSVDTARLEGAPVRELEAMVDTRRLAAVGLTLLDIVHVVREAGRAAATTETASGRAMQPSPGRLPTFAALPVILPAGGSLPLASFAQFRERTVPIRALGASLSLVVRPHQASLTREAIERVDAHLAWLHSNRLMPGGVTIVSPAALTILPRSVPATALAGVVLLSVAVFVLTGSRAGWRWLGAVAGALLTGLGWLALSGDSLNVMTTAALALALAPAASAILLWRPARARPDTKTIGWFLAALLVTPGLLLAADGPAWQPLHASVRVYLVTGIAAVLSVYSFGVGRVPAHRRTQRLHKHGLFRWPAGAVYSFRGDLWRTAVVIVLLASVMVTASLPFRDVLAPWRTGEWRLRLHGDSLDALGAEAAHLEKMLSSLPTLVVEPPAIPERVSDWRVTADAARAQAVGVDPDDVERLVRLTLAGGVIAEFADGGQGVLVRLSTPRLDTDPARELERLIVGGETKDRPLIRLRDVAHADPGEEYAEIRRDRLGRYVEIHGGYRQGERSSPAHDEATVLGTLSAAQSLWSAPGTRWLLWLLPGWLLGLAWLGTPRSERLRAWATVGWGALAPIPVVALCGVIQGGLTVPCLLVAVLLMGIGAAGGVLQTPDRTWPEIQSPPRFVALMVPWAAVVFPLAWIPWADFWFRPLALGLLAGLVAIGLLYILMIPRGTVPRRQGGAS